MLASFPGPMATINRRKAFALVLLGLVVSLCTRPSLGQGSVFADTKELQAKIAQDPELRRYPHLQQFVEGVLPHRQPSLREADPSLAELLEDAKQIDTSDQPYLRLTSPEVDTFFEACVADKLTMLRAIGLIARVVNWSNMVLVIDGRDIDAALKAQSLDVGLALPMEHAALFAYIPHLRSRPPFLCRFFAVYDRAFTYSSPDKATSAACLGLEIVGRWNTGSAKPRFVAAKCETHAIIPAITKLVDSLHTHAFIINAPINVEIEPLHNLTRNSVDLVVVQRTACECNGGIQRFSGYKYASMKSNFIGWRECKILGFIGEFRSWVKAKTSISYQCGLLADVLYLDGNDYNASLQFSLSRQIVQRVIEFFYHPSSLCLHCDIGLFEGCCGG